MPDPEIRISGMTHSFVRPAVSSGSLSGRAGAPRLAALPIYSTSRFTPTAQIRLLMPSLEGLDDSHWRVEYSNSTDTDYADGDGGPGVG